MSEPNPVFEAGPGGICGDCGHFAMRHHPRGCAFPRPEGNPCTCEAFLWNEVRYMRPSAPTLEDATRPPSDAKCGLVHELTDLPCVLQSGHHGFTHFTTADLGLTENASEAEIQIAIVLLQIRVRHDQVAIT